MECLVTYVTGELKGMRFGIRLRILSFKASCKANKDSRRSGLDRCGYYIFSQRMSVLRPFIKTSGAL